MTNTFEMRLGPYSTGCEMGGAVYAWREPNVLLVETCSQTKIISR